MSVNFADITTWAIDGNITMNKHSYTRKYHRKYYAIHKKELRAKNKKWLTGRPWFVSYCKAKQRCINPNGKTYQYYGGKGIKFLMTTEDFKNLWFRDKAYLMKKPSIDRINSNGHYEYSNCRFIECKLNTLMGSLGRGVKVVQYDLNNKYLNTFNSFAEARRFIGIKSLSNGRIQGVCEKKKGFDTAYGYKWEYAQ